MSEHNPAAEPVVKTPTTQQPPPSSQPIIDPVGSIILRTAARAIIPVVLLLAIIVLFQGHNKPGGGFIAGLMVGSCIALHSFAFGPVATRRLLRIDPRTLVGVGLFMAFLSLFVSIALGKPLMTSAWFKIPLPWMDPLKLGTPALFDVGVFHCVAGVTAEMILALQRRAYVEVDTNESFTGPTTPATLWPRFSRPKPNATPNGKEGQG